MGWFQLFHLQALLSVPLSLFFTTGAYGQTNPKEQWYTKYAEYPEYCSTPEQMDKRAIPPLPKDHDRVGETRLIHVTTVIRHGARTPLLGRGQPCWEGYYESMDTGVWNCDLVTYTSSPTPKQVQAIERDRSGQEEEDIQVTFPNLYDAMMDPEDKLANKFNGTCQTGQLLLQGYNQQIKNGEHLRKAYVYSKQNHDHDVRTRLVDVSGSNGQNFWDISNLWFRTDADQRTIMSGEVLLQGMFGPEIDAHHRKTNSRLSIPLHTTDRKLDVVGINENVCPRLAEIKETVEKGRKYQLFNTSKEAKVLRKFISEQLKVEEEPDLLDCLMPVICTDRSLPEVIVDLGIGRNDTPPNPSSKYGTHIFNRLNDFDVRRFNMNLLANDAEYSKLAMAPLWVEIMNNIQPVIEGDQPISKFALFSGHDTTLLPILATLGVLEEAHWPPYASMMNIEIHEFVDGQTDRQVFKSQYAFRLVYNGESITHKVKGCPLIGQLCDADILKNIVNNFAYDDRDCAPTEFTGLSKLWQESKMAFETVGSVLLLIFAMAFGMFFGYIGTYVYLTGHVPSGRGLVGQILESRFGKANGSASNDDGVDHGLAMQDASYEDVSNEQEQFQIDDEEENLPTY